MSPELKHASRHEVPDVLISFRDVAKSFGPVRALHGVSFDAPARSIHAVTGENGAGKSTLMKLLAGILRRDQGEIRLRGRKILFEGPRQALQEGVSCVFQELSLLPNLTIAENLFLGREPARYGIIDRRKMRSKAAEILARLEIGRSVEQLCGELSVSEQQMIEIAKGIAVEADVFIFDEPTAALNGPEVDKLEALLRRLKADGKLVFYISHRLDEIFRYCDLVTVLKDGEHMATRPTTDLDEDALVTLMVGRSVKQMFPARRQRTHDDCIALRVTDLALDKLAPKVSFEVKRGEIVGLAGLEGQGQRDIVRSLAGLRPRCGGMIENATKDGTLKPLGASVVATIAAGIGFVPEDRKAQGLYLPLNIERNIGLGFLRSASLWQRTRADRGRVEQIAKMMGVRAANLHQDVGSLSGGNQQKVMIGRWFAANVDILIIEEPTRGVDVSAKADIYSLLRGFADEGGAVLFTSSELTEHLGLCDRILVVRNKELVADLNHQEASEETVVAYALTGGASRQQIVGGSENNAPQA